MKISQLTRRDIIDAIAIEKINWSGRLEESEFLSRLFDLAAISSYDSRFPDAAGDIWMHRVNTDDWDDNWVFSDARFNLMNGDDETFLAFLCETIHPVVRSDPIETERICQLYNQYLRNDGFQIVEKTRLSGKPVYVGRHVGIGVTPGVSAAKQILGGTDPGYIRLYQDLGGIMPHDQPSRVGGAYAKLRGCDPACWEFTGDDGVN